VISVPGGGAISAV